MAQPANAQAPMQIKGFQNGTNARDDALNNMNTKADQQANLNKIAGGKKRRQRGGDIVVQPLPNTGISSNLSGAQSTNGVNASTTVVANQGAMNAQNDSLVGQPPVVGGGRRKRRSKKSRKSKKSKKTRKSKKSRKSRKYKK